jgi:hypothetical protein
MEAEMKHFYLVVILAAVFTSALANDGLIKEESFSEFYKRFREESEFEHERTVYPIKEIGYTNKIDESLSQEDKDKYKPIRFGEELAYPVIRFIKKGDQSSAFPKGVMSGTETEGFERVTPTVYESYIDLKSGFRALTYTFHLIDGKWYLVEYINIW